MQHFSVDFTAYADDTLLTAGDFVRVLPTGNIVGAAEAIYHSNHAQAGSVGMAAIYRTFWGTRGERDYKARAIFDWANAAGQGRRMGLGVRVSADGTYGYFAVLDSNLGVPRVHIYRRLAGVMTELPGSPVSAAPLASADLNAGVEIQVRIQTIGNTVRLRVSDYTSGTVWFDYEDESDLRIELAGYTALLFDVNATTTDVVVESLIAEDFEDEAEASTDVLDAGITIVRNGEYLAEYQWKALNISPVRATQSYRPIGAVALLEDLNDAHQPALRAGDTITIIYEGTTLVTGVLRKVDQGFQPPESTIYEVIGPRELSGEAIIRDPTTRAGVLGFNQETDSDLYAADRQTKTVGQALMYLLDNAADGEDGLRIRRAAPGSGPLYVSGEMALLDAVIPHLAVSGNVLQAEETLLGYMPEYAIFIDPETLVRHVHKRSTSSYATIALDDEHALPTITTDPSRNFTCVVVRGVYQEKEEQEFNWIRGGGGTLAADWESGLESKIEENKKWIEENSFLVTGIGTDAGHVYVAVDLANVEMAVNEWRGCEAVFYGGPQQGNTYSILRNTGSGQVVLVATTWTGGTPPNVGDRVGLRNAVASGGRPNGFDDVGRAFTLPDGTQFPSGYGLCGVALVQQTLGERTRSYTVKVRRQQVVDPDTQTAYDRIVLDRTGVIVFDEEKDLSVPSVVMPNACGDNPDGNIGLPDEVTFTMQLPSASNPVVPEIRRPAVGFQGTAFSFDSARYGTKRGPGPGDVGVMAPYVIEDGNFTDLALQGAEFTKYADSVLAVLGTLARSGTCPIGRLDVTYAGLDKRLRFTDTSRTLGLETATDIWLFQVDWDFLQEATTLSYGTMAVDSGLRLDAFRQRYAEKTRLDVQKALKKRIEELEECMRSGSDGAVGADSPTGIPSCRVMHAGEDGKSKRLDKVVDGMKPVSCTIDVPARACHNVQCGTILNENNFEVNVARVSALMAGAGAKKTSEILCTLAAHVAAIWATFGGIGVSHDRELSKAAADLTSVRVNLQAIVDCFNQKVEDLCAAVTAVDSRLTCLYNHVNTVIVPFFATKANGAGAQPSAADCPPAPCDVPGDCVNLFTETVCEDPCAQDVPAVDTAQGG